MGPDLIQGHMSKQRFEFIMLEEHQTPFRISLSFNACSNHAMKIGTIQI